MTSLKSILPSWNRLALAALVLTLGCIAPLHAQVTTYSNETAFLNNVATGAYLETFSTFNNRVFASPQSFSFGGYSFTLSAVDLVGQPPDDRIDYSSLSDTDSVYASADSAHASLVITFTSGNVTAIGGNFFVTAFDFSPVAGDSVTETLATGQTITETSTDDYNTEPFAGFTSTTPILSLTISAPDLVGQQVAFATLDNLIVGSAYTAPATASPEPSTWTLMLGGIAFLAGFRRWFTQDQA